jgi:hypothetical protein
MGNEKCSLWLFSTWSVSRAVVSVSGFRCTLNVYVCVVKEEEEGKGSMM